jgi:hypothetical protein
LRLGSGGLVAENLLFFGNFNGEGVGNKADGLGDELALGITDAFGSDGQPGSNAVTSMSL